VVFHAQSPHKELVGPKEDYQRHGRHEEMLNTSEVLLTVRKEPALPHQSLDTEGVGSGMVQLMKDRPKSRVKGKKFGIERLI